MKKEKKKKKGKKGGLIRVQLAISNLLLPPAVAPLPVLGAHFPLDLLALPKRVPRSPAVGNAAALCCSLSVSIHGSAT